MDDPNDPSTKNSIKTDVLYNVPNNVLIDPPYSTFSYPKVEKVGDTIPDPKTVYVTLTAYHESLSDSQTVEVTIRYLDTMYDLSPAGVTYYILIVHMVILIMKLIKKHTRLRIQILVIRQLILLVHLVALIGLQMDMLMVRV